MNFLLSYPVSFFESIIFVWLQYCEEGRLLTVRMVCSVKKLKKIDSFSEQAV